MINLNSIILNTLYILVLLGFVLIYYKDIRALIMSKKRLRIKAKIKKTLLQTNLEKIFITVSKRENVQKYTVEVFILASILIFIFFLVILLKQGFGIIGIIISCVCCLLPYLGLKVKQYNTQYKASYEGEVVIQELLNQYKINYFNMIEAVDNTIDNLEESSLVRRYLFRLSLKIKNIRNDNELRKAIDDFVYSINTEWSKMLANNIYMALSDGANVTTGIEELLKDCKDISQKLETGKRSNSEGFSIIKFLTPALYLTFIWMLYSLLSFPLSKIINYQLNTSTGVILFIAIVIVGFINYAVVMIATKEKYDF